MSDSTPVPMLTVVDSEPVGLCEPDGDYCEVPGAQAEVSESADEPDAPAGHATAQAEADFSRPTPVSS